MQPQNSTEILYLCLMVSRPSEASRADFLRKSLLRGIPQQQKADGWLLTSCSPGSGKDSRVRSWGVGRAAAAWWSLEVARWQVGCTCGKSSSTAALQLLSWYGGQTVAEAQCCLCLMQLCQVCKVVLQDVPFHES